MSPFAKNSHNDDHNELNRDELTHLLPDYINGHLDADAAANVERALSADQDLRAQYEFQIDLQVALRKQAELADNQAQLNSIQGASGFAAITDRLEESAFDRLLNRFSDWFAYRGGVNFPVTALAPALVLVVAVGLIGGLNQGGPNIQGEPNIQDKPKITVNDFETRISVESVDQPTVRILAQPELEADAFAALLRDHGLRLEQHLPDNVVEVTPVAQGEDLAFLVDALRADDRVVFAKVVSPSVMTGSDSR